MENATVTGEGALFPEEGTIPVAFGFSTGPGHGRAIPLYAWSSLTQYYWRDDQVDEIILLIRDRLQRKTIFGHNWLQYDQKWIRYFFSLDRTNVVFDTMLAHYLIDEDKGTHDLEQLAVRYTKMPTWKKTFTLRDTHGTCMYLCKDVDATFRVKEPIEKEMTRKQKNLLKTLLIPLGHELMEMEYRGVKINAENLDKLADIFQMRIAEERKALNEMDEVRAFELTENTEINPKSPYDIGIIMGEYLKLEPLYKTKDGKFGTSAYVLDHYKDIPFVRHIQQLRSLNKLYDSYVEGMRERLKRDGRIHTSYLIHGTRTGRLSSRDPNLQNIPGEGKVGSFIADGSLLKDMFSADEGYTFVEMDYSQIELRALAMYTNDPAWLEMFRSGYDAHSGTAALVFKVPVSEITEEKRRFSKTINFGVVYGMGEESLIYKFTSSGSTEAEARKFMSEHKKIFKRTWEWMDEEEAWVREHYNQETFFGRMRRYDWIDDHAIRQAYNYKIQSTASDFTLTALVRCAKALRELCVDGYPLLTVHDSIAFQVREEQAWEAAEIIKYIAENLNFPFMNVPIKADFKMGRNWGSLKKIDVDKRSFK
jgi:DNA polymerase I